MDKKYKLTNETICYYGRTLHRIEALIDFGNVKIGDKGGFVENEYNLSHKDDCWVFGDAKVFDNARVYENAYICNTADVYSNAKVHGFASIRNQAAVYDNAEIYDQAVIAEEAVVRGNTKVWDHAVVMGNTYIRDSTTIYDSACISGNAYIIGKSCIHGNAFVHDSVIISSSHIFDCAEVYGRAKIRNAEISKTDDYIVFKNWWSSGRYFTWTKSNNMWFVGCFYGTGEELIAKAYKDSELSGKEYERIVRYVEDIYPSVKAIN